MVSDKRRIKRIAVELPVTVYLYDTREKKRLGESLPGRVKNFSPVGAALNVATIMFEGKHLFYTCQDNPDIVIEIEFVLNGGSGKVITVYAVPVWFDWDIEAKEKQFVVGLKFLANSKSPEIQTLSKAACNDEIRLASLWKRLF